MSTIRAQTVINAPANQITAENLVMMLFGMPVERFAQEVKENRNGKYNLAYGKEATKHEETN